MPGCIESHVTDSNACGVHFMAPGSAQDKEASACYSGSLPRCAALRLGALLSAKQPVLQTPFGRHPAAT